MSVGAARTRGEKGWEGIRRARRMRGRWWWWRWWVWMKVSMILFVCVSTECVITDH
jgi:hypothetical protein